MTILKEGVCGETCLNEILNKTKSYINQTLNEFPMQETFVNLTCINQTPFYPKYKNWTPGGSA
jgi:hypothetical protein